MSLFSLPPFQPSHLRRYKISKFFKKNPSSNVNKKLYAQVSSNSSNSNGTNIARETLKIKEAFSSLQNKKNQTNSENY